MEKKLNKQTDAHRFQEGVSEILGLAEIQGRTVPEPQALENICSTSGIHGRGAQILGIWVSGVPGLLTTLRKTPESLTPSRLPKELGK